MSPEERDRQLFVDALRVLLGLEPMNEQRSEYVAECIWDSWRGCLHIEIRRQENVTDE